MVLAYPRDGQLDVPVGAKLIVSFSDAIAGDAAAGCSVVGPAGAIDITTSVVGGGKTLAIVPTDPLAPGAEYAIELGEAPVARFTARSERPVAGPPTLIALDGSPPASPGSFRPILDTSTLQLVFSEPLDPRTVALEPGALELLDAAGTPVPATLLARGIHATIDPDAPLAAGATYELRLGDHLADAGGEHFAATSLTFVPQASTGASATQQTFRTRADGDVDGDVLRTDASNVMDVSHPLIGAVSGALHPAVIETELGDPTALGGPIAFTIPRGQRLYSSGLDIAFAGAVPSGLTTGDIAIELVTDAGGLLYRNTFAPADATPDNTDAPLLVDLSLDLGVYATDPTGNAVLAQTILGVQLSGIAVADNGAIAIESLGAADIELLGIAAAPANLVLDLISDATVAPDVDTRAPTLLASLPAAGSHDLAADQGIELVFDEPIDVERANAGGITLHDDAGAPVAALVEGHGSVAVVRPRAPLADGHGYHVDLAAVADLAGNAMAPLSISATTPAIGASTVPPTVVAITPGAPCVLVAATDASPGRCAGGRATDDTYQPFTLAADEDIRVAFDQPISAYSLALGTACGAGSVRVEQLDAAGHCTGVVPGKLLRHRRDLAFVPAAPWTSGQHYRLTLVSGPDAHCDEGEICGVNGVAASFDPLAGTAAAGGPDLASEFVATDSAHRSSLVAGATPFADANGNGRVDSGEVAPDTNRVALRIAGTSGIVTSASFSGPDCLPATPEVEACMFVLGAVPAQLGEARDNCALPDGTTAAHCVPVEMSPQAMYSTSVTMTAAALGIPISSDTGTSVLRMRPPASHPLEGYIVDGANGPTLVAALDLYMDAPDMTLPIGQHDLHSKPLSVMLQGPVAFLADGRLSLSLANTADVAITVDITALGLSGAVQLVVPAGEMKLQLLTAPQRGALP